MACHRRHTLDAEHKSDDGMYRDMTSQYSLKDAFEEA